MTTGIDVVYDATHVNIGSLPTGASYAGYVTGSGGVPWTTEDFAKYPDAIRVDQTPANTQWDATADVDDYENGAVALNELAPRAKERQTSFNTRRRPGQRTPVVYASAKDLTAVANALNSGGVTSGVGLWVANWNLTESTSIADILAASRPFPIVGIQFHNAGAFDISVFSIAWLTNRASSPPPPPPPPVKDAVPPGQWNNPNEWTWKTATLTGTGLDNNQHRFDLDTANGKWNRVS